mmetsp:Transcript_5919/g.9772  ORF Transcript_5919/g.9772 Transcript_5919/m.9772 type:complete len:201 (+) Transcript_5919:322-924(+)
MQRQHRARLPVHPSDVDVDFTVIRSVNLIHCFALLEFKGKLCQHMNQPLETVNFILSNNPIEVYNFRVEILFPAVLGQRAQDGGARRETNACADQHDGSVVRVVFGGGRVRAVDAQDLLAIGPVLPSNVDVSAAVPFIEEEGELLDPRTHQLEVLLQPAGPCFRVCVLQSVHFDVDRNEVAVASVALVQVVVGVHRRIIL